MSDFRKEARHLIRGPIEVTVTGAQGVGKTVLVGLIREFLKMECGFDGPEVVVRLPLPKEPRLRDRLRQIDQERQAKVILVDIE